MDKFILDKKGNPVPEPDALKWSKWFENAGEERIVMRSMLLKYTVSTVFMGLDHDFSPRKHRPLLYETMVFETKTSRTKIPGTNKSLAYRKSLDKYTQRYATKKAALVGHEEVLALVRKLKK